jgi:hypothetical protein
MKHFLGLVAVLLTVNTTYWLEVEFRTNWDFPNSQMRPELWFKPDAATFKRTLNPLNRVETFDAEQGS